MCRTQGRSSACVARRRKPARLAADTRPRYRTVTHAVMYHSGTFIKTIVIPYCSQILHYGNHTTADHLALNYIRRFCFLQYNVHDKT